MAWAASRPARCPACAHGAIMRCCSARPLRRRAEWCSSTDSTPGCETGPASFPITTQRYAPDVLHPDGASRIAGFTREPWPTWEFELPGGIRLRQEIVRAARPARRSWRWTRARRRTRRASCTCGRSFRGATITPCITRTAASGSTPTRSTRASRFGRTTTPGDRGAVATASIGTRRTGTGTSCIAAEARARPRLTPKISRRRVISLAAGKARRSRRVDSASRRGERSRAAIGRRRGVDPRPCPRSGDGAATRRFRPRSIAPPTPISSQRGSGRTIVAGYPWFTDWGRDTFIAIRGLCLATGRLADARDILVEWAGAVSEGMLPNRFPDRGEAPEFNSVDASLWYVIAAHELLRAATRRSGNGSRPTQRQALEAAIEAIVRRLRRRHALRDSHGRRRPARGRRRRRAVDVDGRAGRRSGDHAEDRQAGRDPGALAQRAVRSRRASTAAGATVLERGRAAFSERFWDEDTGGLADVVDVDHVLRHARSHAPGRTRSSRLEDCR